MKQFLAAVLVAVLVLPSVSQAAWTRFEDSYVFGDFVYNESTDEWVHDDGTYYESSAELFDCYGFYYDSWRDVWYNEDGFIDEDFCVRDHSDGGFFYCDSCENLMFSFESDDPDCHTGDCLDLGEYEEYGEFEAYDDFEAEEDSYYAYDSYDSYDPPDTSDPEEDSDPEKEETSIVKYVLMCAAILYPLWLPIVGGVVLNVIENNRSRKNK